ncbi:YbaB/EbfC family nucleoid-associated protein [Mycolicibacterium sp.]|uniref:YbaB/EbfC family nucleoid-associated protein n=1 Tax=Mycolicibacterium sp. TaxID=2320850 RepID=UPI0037C80F20
MREADNRLQSSHSDAFDLDDLLTKVQKFQQSVAGSTQRQALEVADAWSKDDLVHVWVNAQGLVIKAEVDEQAFSTATAESIGAAMVEAAQAAATKMRQKTQAFQAELREKLSALTPSNLPSLVDIEQLRAFQPSVPTSPPGSKERQKLASELPGNATSAPHLSATQHHSVSADPPDDWDDDFTLRA